MAGTADREVCVEEDEDSDIADFGTGEDHVPSAPPSPSRDVPAPMGNIVAQLTSMPPPPGGPPPGLSASGSAGGSSSSSGPVVPTPPQPPAARAHVVPPPGQGPALSGPPPEEDVLPQEDDGDGWLELLRDGLWTDFREICEYPQPLPYHRVVTLHSHEGGRCPKGKFPRQALQKQLHMLQRFRVKEAIHIMPWMMQAPRRGPDGKEQVTAFNQMQMQLMAAKADRPQGTIAAPGGPIVITGHAGGKGKGGGKGKKGVHRSIGK